jgi:pilus assembly protein CpaD
MTKTDFLRSTGAALALGLVLAATPASAGRRIERGVEPIHQPVVERTDFVFDLAPDGSGALGTVDARRLETWFRALNLRYGDHVTLAGSGTAPPATQAGVAEIVARFGLLVEGEAPVTAGDAPVGGLRIVVSRSVASVPGCPSWRDRAEANFNGGLSDNYGCATAMNLAAMVADPRDLVEGRQTGVDDMNVVNGKAIKAYQEKAPTGAGALQSMSAGGN